MFSAPEFVLDDDISFSASRRFKVCVALIWMGESASTDRRCHFGDIIVILMLQKSENQGELSDKEHGIE